MLALTACGASGGGGGGKGVGPKATSPGEGQQALKVNVPVPRAFDSTKGWQEALPWVPEDATSRPYAAAPGAGVVALLKKQGRSYILEARDEATGALRFGSKPWQPPKPQEITGKAIEETPGVEAVRQDGREYLAVWAQGTDSGDALNKPQQVVEVDIYPVDTSGATAAPAHVVKVPIGEYSGVARARDGGVGLLISAENGDESVSVDMRTGQLKHYPSTTKLGEPTCGAIGCVTSEVKALTSHGPVLANSVGGFGVPGVWNSSRVVPPGAETHDYAQYKSTAHFAVSGHLIASWSAADNGNDIWAVHNAETGRVEASTKCSATDLSEWDTPSALSMNGRYLLAGPLAFDLTSGKGYCFASSGTSRQIQMLSVDDDGQAYGIAQGEDTAAGASVSVPMSTGHPAPLPHGQQPPFLSLHAVGAFSPSADGSGVLFVFLLRR
ncbi:hypothetical protein ACH41H_43700 [Streptomyces sp. NPDC020800]|uniref:hypothetical protein n=1 Tax=Streptomyces sp. NPDC020800 TaxID=3365092 RepID=UPI0037A1EEDF